MHLVIGKVGILPFRRLRLDRDQSRLRGNETAADELRQSGNPRQQNGKSRDRQ